MKKFLAIVCALAITSGLISGCAANTASTTAGAATAADSTAAATTAEATPAAEKVTLSLCLANSWYTDALKTGIAMYEEKTGNTIEVEVVPDDQTTTMLQTRLATQADVPDIIANYPTTFNVDTLKTNMAPLTGDWVSKLNEDHVAGYYKAVDGNIYGAPYGGATALGLIYNKEIFAANNIKLPIKTFTEFLAACETLKAAGVIPLSLSNKEGWTAQIMGLDQQWTGMSEDDLKKLTAGELTYPEIPTLKVLLENMNKINELGYVNPDYMSTTMDMAISDVATGRCAMTPAGDWSYSPTLKNFPDQAENVGMMPVPVRDDSIFVNIGTSSKFFMATVNGKAGNTEAAIQFIDFMMSDETLVEMYKVEPAICPVQGIDTQANAWDAEMITYSSEIPYAPLYPIFSTTGFSIGDFAGSIQAMFGGKSVDDTLQYWYDDCKNQNKAAGTAGF